MSSTGVGQKELTAKVTKPYLHNIATLSVSERHIGKGAYLPDAPPKAHHQKRIG